MDGKQGQVGRQAVVNTSQEALCLLLRIVGVSELHGMPSGDLGRNLPTEVFAPVTDDPCNPLYSTSTLER